MNGGAGGFSSVKAIIDKDTNFQSDDGIGALIDRFLLDRLNQLRYDSLVLIRMIAKISMCEGVDESLKRFSTKNYYSIILRSISP